MQILHNQFQILHDHLHLNIFKLYLIRNTPPGVFLENALIFKVIFGIGIIFKIMDVKIYMSYGWNFRRVMDVRGHLPFQPLRGFKWEINLKNNPK